MAQALLLYRKELQPSWLSIGNKPILYIPVQFNWSFRMPIGHSVRQICHSKMPIFREKCKLAILHGLQVISFSPFSLSYNRCALNTIPCQCRSGAEGEMSASKVPPMASVTIRESRTGGGQWQRSEQCQVRSNDSSDDGSILETTQDIFA